MATATSMPTETIISSSAPTPHQQDFRCVICLRVSPTGWLWRCTQDRELLLEDDAAFDNDKLDAICDLFARSTVPRKRSPAARASKLSFLDEISDEELKTYTRAQISQILVQRSHILDVARDSSEAARPDSEELFFENLSTDITSTTPHQYSSKTPPVTSAKPPRRYWQPSNDAECQFKCCHCCRPSLLDRSYLSLDEIANGSIPLTAAAGFGFHLLGYRPVSLVKHVQILGLRPSPPHRDSSPFQPQRQESNQEQLTKDHLFPPPIGLGLALFPTGSAQRRLPSPPTTINPSHIPETEPENSIAPISRSTTRKRFEAALLTPLPEQSAEELAIISMPPTPMEEGERGGMFGSAPLDLRSGVAVTEEAVGLHVPDLITPF